jgi:hypothetical protein
MLKRHWKLYTLIIVIFLTISTFYLKLIFSNTDYPNFTIKTVEGDPSEINNLTLEGYYSPDSRIPSEFGMIHSDKYFSLIKNKTLYDKQTSFLSQLTYIDITSPLATLQKEHKKFFRGKTLLTQNFFEDDSFLVYIELNQEYLDKNSGKRYFSISMLNKKTDEQLTYTIDFPEAKDYQFVDIQKIQIINSNLTVLTRNDFPQTDPEMYHENSQEYHIYQLDLGNQKVATDNLISFDSNSSANEVTSIELISETKINQTSDNLFFSLSYQQPFDEENARVSSDSKSRIPSYELYHYKISTEETKKILLPKEYNKVDSTIVLDRSKIYSYHYTDNEIDLYTTNLMNLDESSKKTITLPVSKDTIEWQSIKNNKIYSVSSTKQSPLKKQLFIYDLANNKLIYEGSIEPTSGSSLAKESGVRIDYGLVE